jgi:protein TonB
LVDDIGDEVLEITEIDIDVKQPLALDQPILWDVDTVLDEPDIPILHPGIMPEYPGGLKKLYSFIAKGIRYPDPARRAGIQGTVHVQFIVRKDGTITDLEILRGIGFGCDEEALRVLKQMEDWMPGMQMNRPISVIMRIPIIFTLK